MIQERGNCFLTNGNRTMKSILSLIAKVRLRRLCLRKKCVLSKLKTKVEEFPLKDDELDRLEKNIRRVKQEIHNHAMNQALDRMM